MARRPSSLIAATALGWACTLAGCAASPTALPDPTGLPAPTPTLPPSGIPVPAVARMDPETGAWLVLGLAANPGSFALAHPSIRLTLPGTNGQEPRVAEHPFPIEQLPAGDSWPFAIPWDQPGEPSDFELELLGAEAEAQDTRVEAEIVTTFTDPDGRRSALGRLTNRSASPAHIDAVRLLASDASGNPAAVAEAIASVDILPAGESAPFLARLPLDSPTAWQAFVAVSPADSRSPAVEASILATSLDAQGHPLVVAHIRNRSDLPADVRFTAVLELDGAWAAAATVALPLPLLPGEGIDLAVRAPSGPGETAWRPFLAAVPAAGNEQPLGLEVVGVEAAGSNLVLRLRIAAPPGGAVRAAAYVTVQDAQGDVVTAGLSPSPIELSPGETALVTLALPIPAGFDLALAEFDLRAAGVPLGPP